jgi:hypothetical protein
MELGKLAHSQLQPAQEEEFFNLSLVGVVLVSIMMDSNSYGGLIVDLLRLVIIVRVENLKIAWMTRS